MCQGRQETWPAACQAHLKSLLPIDFQWQVCVAEREGAAIAARAGARGGAVSPRRPPLGARSVADGVLWVRRSVEADSAN